MSDPKARVEHQLTLLQNFRNKAHALRKRLAWAVKKRTVHRKKLKAAREAYKKSRKPKFETYMLNGHSNRITDAVRQDIALGVLKYDLACTSTSDGIPGDGRHTSTSLHYWQNNADHLGHADDMAGAKMTDFQHAQRKRGIARYQELFGPDNNGWIKNGQSFNEPEGTPLENLHDTHVHSAPYA